MLRRVAIVAFFPSIALASDLITIEPSYRLREGHGFKYKWSRVFRKPTKARITATKGPWRRVCIGGTYIGCKGGESGWVYFQGIREQANPDAETTGGCTGDCKGSSAARPERAIEGIATAIGDNPRGFKLPNRPYAANCGPFFITPRGLGDWGMLMTKTAELKAKDCFYESNFFGPLCPNYLSLPMAHKKAVLAAMFAAMGHHESTCNPEEQVWAYTGYGDGMFMMEHSARVRAQSRDPVLCETNNDRANTKSPIFQANCTISIIRDTICRSTRDVRLINRRRHNYFQEFKGNGAITRTFRNTVKGWGVCR